MTVRLTFRSVLLAASVGALALASAAPASAAPGGWEQRGPGGGERERGERGENRGGGGARQQAPAQQQPQPQPVVQQQPRMPQSPPSMPVQAQPRGPASWQGNGAPAGSGWQGRPANVPQGNPQPAWRNSAEPDRAVIRTRPYGANPTPAGQPAWRGRDQGNASSPGTPGTPGWQNERREGGGTWSRDGDAGRWQRDRDNNRNDNRADGDGGRGWNDRNQGNQGNQWQGNQWRNDQRRNGQWRGNPAWSNQRTDRGGDWNRGGDNRRWDNGWRRDNRYDWFNWRSRNRNVFHGGTYYAPFRGYNYSQLSIGIFLGAPFYAQQYWLSDPWAYRLPPAYGSYRWVRYYDDVILVDIYTGEVVDVIHDFFW
ncbi:RcnB family protein [Novosphingobium sp.]|uniref:RcnB family protein n=1 Tax=Novosphingobium sp. TaxID=1874826 RepID=UPI0038B6DC8B